MDNIIPYYANRNRAIDSLITCATLSTERTFFNCDIDVRVLRHGLRELNIHIQSVPLFLEGGEHVGLPCNPCEGKSVSHSKD